MRRKTSRKALLKHLDDAFGDFIKARDRFCVTCGSTEKLDCSHLVRKARGNFLRWHPDNAYAQCRTCHQSHHNASEAPLILYAVDKLGRARVEQMQIDAHTETHFKNYQLEEMTRYWRKKLNGHEAGEA